MASVVTAGLRLPHSAEETPATVVTGFLGSGKTTIISHWIESLSSAGKNVIYIKNELGEEDLDAKLMRGRHIISREILNGCVCCTLVGPFISAIEEVVDTYGPERIIIESSGTADPASLALMVSDHPLLRRDGVISIIDTLNFEGYHDLSPVARRQAVLTDLIVLNKIELVDLDQIRRVVGYIRELNEASPIVEAPRGRLNPDLAFGLTTSDLDALLNAEEKEAVRHGHAHLEDDQIEAFAYTSDSPLSKASFQQAFTTLPKQLIRIKGIANFSSGAEVVNAIFRRVDYSVPPASLENSSQTVLICIGYQVKALEPEIRLILDRCQEN